MLLSKLKQKGRTIFNLWRGRKQSKQVALRNKQKVFVIGFNKTGTTSVHAALLEFDLIVGHQPTAEHLLKQVIKENLQPLINHCRTAEAFQDVPFSLPDIYKVLDQAFPNSKFILTERDTPEQWFNSIKKFHGKLWANNQTPTKDDLAKATYTYPSFALDYINHVFGNSYYDPEVYEKTYLNHNQSVKEYFKDRPESLLVINVAKKESYKQLCEFIGETPLRETFEWKNRTKDILSND